MTELFKKISLIILLLLSNGSNCNSKFVIKKDKSNKLRKLKHCYKSCKECYGPAIYFFGFLLDQNCKVCAQGYYKLGESDCYNDQIANEGYYLNGEKWEKCYEKCRTCSDKGDSNNMNCLSCKNSWKKNTKYRLDNNNCVMGCSDDKYYSGGNCLYNCPSNLYSYSVDHTCLTDCPENYIKNEGQKKCVLTTFEETTILDDFQSQVTENITNYINHTSLINGSDFIAIILSNDKEEPEKQLEKGISAVDLGECANIIKDYYNISRNESLIILNIESKINLLNNLDEEEEGQEIESEEKSFNLGKITQVEVFDMSGRSLNISVCEKNIKIMKFINDSLDESDIEMAKSLSNQGIDVFNPNDNFFNDICHKYNSEGKDIILKDRRNDYYINTTFCQNGCTYIGMNYDLNVANCLCDTSSVQGEKIIENNNKEEKSENLNFKTIAETFASNLLDFNFDVIFCYNLIFDFQRLAKNIGFYIMFIMLILQIIFLIILLIKKFKSIKDFMFQFYNPKKNIKQTLSTLKNNFTNITNNGKKTFKEESNINLKNNINKVRGQNKSKFIFINNYAPIIKIHFNNINNNINGNKNLSRMQKIYNFSQKNKKPIKNQKTNNNKLYKKNPQNKPNTFLKNKSLHYLETKTENIIKNKKANIKNDIIDVDDLLDMEYTQAITKNRSTFLKIYWAFLLDSQIILATFFTKNYLQLFVIKLSFLVCTFNISFFLNALFYTDDYISDAYHNNGVLDFFSGLPKSIYSYVITLISTNLLRMLNNSKSELMRIIRKNSTNKNYIDLMESKLKTLRNKLIIYFIIVFSFELGFLYYVSAFCAVYTHSKKYWFFGCLESFAIDTSVAIVLCIILAFLRYISIRRRIKYLYILSNVISKIL